MGKIFTLETETLSIVQDALDDLITEFGKECLLVYPPKMVACSNCTTELKGNPPANRWRTGNPSGPSPICSVCNGSGNITQEETETIMLGCTYEPKGFFRPVDNVNIRIKNATLQTKCYLKDAPKLVRCSYLYYQISVAAIVRARFELASDPVDISNIVKGRYAVAYWNQVAA